MRSLTTNEMRAVSGGTSIFDYRAWAEGFGLLGDDSPFFDATDTGNVAVDLINSAMFVTTGEISAQQVASEFFGGDLTQLANFMGADVEKLASGNYIINGQVVGASHFESGAWFTGAREDMVDEVGVIWDLIMIAAGSVGGAGENLRSAIAAVFFSGAAAGGELNEAINP